MSFIEEIRKEKQKLERAYKKASERLVEVPQGNLQCSISENHVKFFHNRMVDQKRERRYLRKSEKDLIYALAQKEYDSKIQKITGKQLKLLYKLERSLDNASLDDILHELHPAKQDLVLPVELTREQKLMKWYEKEYRGKEIAENDPKFQTKKGEYVRSKSEKILADCFYDHGILYKYECPLQLVSGRVIFPDFTFYNIEDEKEIYWEHDGMMNDEKYANNAVKKINEYIKSGIYPGTQLICTFESMNSSLDSSVIEKLVSMYLIPYCVI